jgi:hypothetical protein
MRMIASGRARAVRRDEFPQALAVGQVRSRPFAAVQHFITGVRQTKVMPARLLGLAHPPVAGRPCCFSACVPPARTSSRQAAAIGHHVPNCSYQQDLYCYARNSHCHFGAKP